MAGQNKTSLILKHLESKKSITSWEAIENYGATRLSDIIFRLRNKGYAIESKTERGVDRYGSAISYARYFLKGKPEEGEG